MDRNKINFNIKKLKRKQIINKMKLIIKQLISNKLKSKD